MITLLNKSKHWAHFLDSFSLVDGGYILLQMKILSRMAHKVTGLHYS